MSKTDNIFLEGTVKTILGYGKFLIEMDNGMQIIGKRSGRMARAKIRLLPGDEVDFFVSPYDVTTAVITYRR